MFVHQLGVSVLAMSLTATDASAGQAVRARPEPPENARAAGSSMSEEQVVDLVRRLKDPNWQVRERATDKLKKAGSETIKLLAIAYQVHRSPEIRLRIKAVVEHLVMRSEVHKSGGFLGVRQRLATQADDRRIPAGRSGVMIVEVLEDTAAERAGLRRRDIILQLNDKGIDGEAGVVEFTKAISTLEPGTEVRLTVLRDGKVMTLTATLGQRPLEYVGPQSASYLRAQEQFGQTWRKFFDPSDKRAGVVALEARQQRLRMGGRPDIRLEIGPVPQRVAPQEVGE